MRYLSVCVLCLAIVTLLTPFSFCQYTNGANSNNSVFHEQILYQEYQQGIVVNTDGVVKGVLLHDVNGVGEPIAGVKLVIIGGDDFVITVETDENGEFTFEGAEVGYYSVVILDENGTLSSLDFKVTAFDPDMQTIGPNTGVNGILKLVVDENGNLRFAATRGSVMSSAASAGATLAATTTAGMGGAAGGMGGGAGGFGAMAGALGIAGLVSGITALASNNDSSISTPPVSVGAPRAR